MDAVSGDCRRMLKHRAPEGNCVRSLPGGFTRGGWRCYFVAAGVQSAQSGQEDAMAKGQMRSNKEKKKPKADTGKVKQVSAYKASQTQSGKK
jgi:type VI protein secretion system component VasK